MTTPARRILRDRELDETTKTSRITRWRWRRKGKFPAPVELGPNCIGYFEDEIQEWLSSRPRRGGADSGAA
jgi:prophage regulatory protein